MLSLRAMLHLELPHINVLSKIDLIRQYGDLGASCSHYLLRAPLISVLLRTRGAIISVDFNLDYYTEVQDLSYLENLLTQQTPRYAALNMALCSLIEDTPLVGFETLAVEVSTYSRSFI